MGQNASEGSIPKCKRFVGRLWPAGRFIMDLCLVDTKYGAECI
jgi:hypothetical protein